MALLGQLLLPLGAMLLAAFLEFHLQRHPEPALFLAWLLMAIAALLLLIRVKDALRNEAGLLDAAELVTLAWFMLLSSALGAASLWNVYAWKPGDATLGAFVTIPGQLWVMAGLPLIANFGVRLAFSMRGGAVRTAAMVPPMQQLLASPLDPAAKPQMGNAQYMILNLIVLLVYAIAIARLFSAVVVGGTVGSFPDIPEEVLALIGVSVGGFVATTAIPR